MMLLSSACGSKPAPAPPVREGARANRSAATEEDDEFDSTQVPGRIHLVQANETLWSLAEQYYGNSKHWRKILVANRRRVTDPTNLPVGMKLIIP